MGDVLNYFEIAEIILEELQIKKTELSKEVLEAVCLAWQLGKKKVKSKESNRKKYCAAKEKYYYLNIALNESKLINNIFKSRC